MVMKIPIVHFVSFSIIRLVESWSTIINLPHTHLKMTQTLTNLACSNWMWPNESSLEILDNELETIQNKLSTTRRVILESYIYDNSPLIEERMAQRRDRDAAIVSACTNLLPELDANTIDAIKSNAAFCILDSILPIPKGLLRPNQEHSLAKYVSAQIKRHSPASVHDIETKAVRDHCDATLDNNESWQEANQSTQQSITQVIERHLQNLTWSDHKPIRATLGTIRVAAWNIMERKPNGIHPVLPILTFVKGSKEERKNSVARLEHAILHHAAVVAHAHAVVQWTLEALKTHDAVCLSEVGAPVVNALQSTDLVVSISKPTQHQSLNPSRITKDGGACEGRTAVVARSGKLFPDIPVMVGTKVRFLACLQLNNVIIVSVHVPRRAGGDSRCPEAGGGLFAAREAVQTLSESLLAVGDWNGNVELIGGIRVGKPTTFADVVLHPESHGIDGALSLSSKDRVKVECYT